MVSSAVGGIGGGRHVFLHRQAIGVRCIVKHASFVITWSRLLEKRAMDVTDRMDFVKSNLSHYSFL